MFGLRILKYEYFDQQGLLLLLNFVKARLEDTEERKEYWKLLEEKLRHYFYASECGNSRSQVVYKFSRSQKKVGLQFVGRIFGQTKPLYYKGTKKCISIQSLPRWVRSVLCEKYYFDLDIVNAHPSILLSVCNLLFPENSYAYLTYYCENRDKVLELLAQYYKKESPSVSQESKSFCKLVLTRILYGGGWDKIQQHPNEDAIESPPFTLQGYKTEVNTIAKRLILILSNNSKEELENNVRKALEISGITFPWRSKLISDYLYQSLLKAYEYTKQSGKGYPSFLAMLLQEIERNVLGTIEKVLIKKGRKIDVYIHDGCLIRKKIVIKSTGELHDWTYETLNQGMGKKIKFEKKLTDEINVLHECSFRVEEELGLKIQLYVKPFQRPNAIIDQTELGESNEEYSKTDEEDAEIGLIPEDDLFPKGWRDYFKANANKEQAMPLKSYEELKYFNETHKNLAYIIDKDRFLYDSYLITPEMLKLHVKERFCNYRGQVKEFTEIYKDLKGERREFSKIELVRPKQSKYFETSLSLDPLAKPINALGTGVDPSGTCYLLAKELGCGFPLLHDERAQETILPFDELDLLPVLTSANHPFFTTESFIWKKFSKKSTRFEEFSKLTLPFFNHIYIVLGRNQKYFEYFVKYLAKIANYPEEISNFCGLIFFGKAQGIGKSQMVKMASSLFAPFSKETQDPSALFARFTDLMELALLLHLEDAPSYKLRNLEELLKGRLTASTIKFEKKGQPLYDLRNFCRVIISTNLLGSIKLETEDRRWAAFSCSAELIGNATYFTALNDYWSFKEVRKRVLQTLLSLDVSNFNSEKERPITPYLSHLMGQQTLWHESDDRLAQLHQQEIVHNPLDAEITDDSQVMKVDGMMDKHKTTTFPPIEDMVHSFMIGISLYLANQNPKDLQKLSHLILPKASVEGIFWMNTTLLNRLYKHWLHHLEEYSGISHNLTLQLSRICPWIKPEKKTYGLIYHPIHSAKYWIPMGQKLSKEGMYKFHSINLLEIYNLYALKENSH